jgi:predicted acetyltransferase
MVTLAKVDADDLRLGRLMQHYIHGWSRWLPIPIGQDALFVYEELPRYRDQVGHAALLILDDDGRAPIGFALARQDELERWHVEEFFVIYGARRRGVGMLAARALFALHPGAWTLTVRPENPTALPFWRRVAPGAEERIEIGDDGIPRTRFSWIENAR